MRKCSNEEDTLRNRTFFPPLLAYPCSVYPLESPSAFSAGATLDPQLPNKRAVSNILKGRPSAVGWVKNLREKLGPQATDLGPLMDPFRYVLIFFSFFVRCISRRRLLQIGRSAVGWNLKLMMGWGIIPNLGLEKVSATQSAFPRCCHAQTLRRPTLMVCFCIQNFTLPTSFYRAGASTP